MSKLTWAGIVWMALAAVLGASLAGRGALSAVRELNTDRPGLEIRDFDLTAPLPDQCEAACNKEKGCQAWTFAWPGKRGPRARCFLKSGLPPKKSDNCCITGTRTQEFRPESGEPKKVDEEIPKTPSPQPETVAQPELPLEDACRNYATTAVDQNRQNQELFCDLTGSRWGFDYDIYFNWCMKKSTRESRVANTEARNKDLGACKAFFGIREPQKPKPRRDVARENACREYANRSLVQSEEARELGCGFSGPRWSPLFNRIIPGA